MSDLLCDNGDVMDALLAALSDPGRFTPRAPLEPVESWQRRAVVEHAAPRIQAAERERIRGALDAWQARYPAGGGMPEDLIADLRAIIGGEEESRDAV